MRRIEKPWGHELIWAHTDRYVGKILHIRKGEALSLQYHSVKDETVLVLRGSILLCYENDQLRGTKTLKPGSDAFRIPPGLVHRMIALEDADVVEVSTPELDDVVRLEDRYGRGQAGEYS